jgi:hypothetical protein
VGENGRWSLDHLFLDQDGMPTFVECKRSVDTRTRREVVVQMLDYAANGVEYWSMDRLRQSADETAQQQGKKLDEGIARLLDQEGPDIQAYWTRVEENLHNRKIRLLFVTDEVPRELRRLVEFLNEELTHVEVLAVEIKQFQGQDTDGHKALVPRVLGLTEAVIEKKRHVTEAQFLQHCRPEIRSFFTRVWEMAEERDYAIYWGTAGFSIRADSVRSDRLASFVYGFPSGDFQVRLHDFSRHWKIETEVLTDLRNKLLAFGVFKESGEWGLRAMVTSETILQMNQMYDFIIDQVSRMAEME